MREVTWNDFVWPEWVPEKVRSEIVRSWGPPSHSTILDWVENAKQNKCPLFGSGIPVNHTKQGVKVAFKDEHFEFIFADRFIFAWNNMARIVHDDGRVEVVSSHPTSPEIDWSVVQPASFDDLKQYVPSILIEKDMFGVYWAYVEE